MYGFWSSKKNVIILAALMQRRCSDRPLQGIDRHNRSCSMCCSSCRFGESVFVVAVLSVYIKIYPTHIPSSGTGFAAGASKAGGVSDQSALVAFNFTGHRIQQLR